MISETCVTMTGGGTDWLPLLGIFVIAIFIGLVKGISRKP